MIRAAKHLLCVAVVLCWTIRAAAGDSALSQAEALFGPIDCSAAVGNGSLTVSVNRFGRITGCRWPSPGYYDQISYRTTSADLPDLGVAPSDGVMWGIRINDETHWLTGAPWRTRQRYLGPDSNALRTVSSLPDLPVKVSQTLFVHNQSNVMACRIVVEGLDEPPELFWYANFTPCTRLLPELPLGDWALDATNDFAAIADPVRNWMCHFRPLSPSSEDWGLAARVAEEHLPPSEWAAFEEGAWILYAADGEVAGFQCGLEGEASSALIQSEAGPLNGDAAAVGACNSALAVRPAEQHSGAYAATVFVAVGKDYPEVSNALSGATVRGYSDLLKETEEHWENWLSRASIPGNPDPDVVALAKRCLLTMATATDLYSRAVVRAPVSQPPLFLDWPRHGVWTTHAYDLAGFHGLAEEHALFYLDAFRGTQDSTRRGPERGKPFGSLPAALYANGVEALPHVVLEPEAAAYTLLSYWQHSGFLSPPRRAVFLGSVWETVNASADFLVGWADGNTGAPLHSFNWSQLRDTPGPELTLATFAGLKSALRIAKALGHERQDWERRLRELEPILLQGCLDFNGSWRVADPLPYWLAGLEPLERPLREAASSRLETLARLEGVDAARTLYHLSMIWKQHPEQIAELTPLLKPTLKRSLAMPDDAPALSAAFPDAVAASYAFLATRNLLTFRGWGEPPGGVE